MLIIPAIDIKGGDVVRLVQGKKDQKIYSRDPVKTAKHWCRQGVKLIHIVDLDGAASGKPKNIEAVKRIAKESEAQIQFGGGVRSIDTIQTLLDSGVWRVVLGTKAVEDPGFLKKAFKKFSQKIIVSIDAKNDTIAINGWQENHKKIKVLEFVKVLEELGFKQIIYTDIMKDGTLTGPNIKALKALLKETKMKIIASGGVSALSDIHKLKALETQGVTGVIIGKALYEGKFTFAQALNFA
jgi:phosphoribosylformimino-5-aminoimidazole carboxamide ribotide isomerase